MKETIMKRVSAKASVLGLGVLLVFTGCVKQHENRSGQGDIAKDVRRYAIQPGTMADKKGVEIQSLSGMYQTETEYLGCEPVAKDLAVGTLTESNKVVVEFSGKKAACVRVDDLKSLKERPPVTLLGALGDTPYEIQTRKVLRKTGRTAALEGVESDEGTGIRLLDTVSYSTNSPILNAVADRLEVRALPGQKYKVYHKITPNFLYIMMVVPKDKMGHMDFPLSDNLGNGNYAVPIAWAGISLLKQELRLNADNEKTNVIDYNEVETIAEATHIDLDLVALGEIELKTLAAVEDMYPADYFTKGQWYFSESVVDTRPGSEGFIGTTTGAFDTSFRSATRVQFTRRSTGLVACNVSIDERYADDVDCAKSDSVLTIPGTSQAYGMVPNKGLMQVYDVPAANAPFYTLELDATTSVRKSIDEFISIISDTNKDQIIKINFHKNKFSFVTQRGTNGRRVMYSFLRTDGRTPYSARRHYKDDRQNKFGYFVQTVSKIRSSDTVAREEDLEKDYLVQRHNPDKDIVFHFSSLTPDYSEKSPDPYGLKIDYREIGKKSIEYWAKAYERAGAPNTVVLGEGDVPFGDIAYNTMNLIDSERGSNLLGVGPSLVDPYSGEVVNANANVYIAPFREILAGQVRNYIKAKTGLLDDATKQLPVGAAQNSTLLGDMASSTLGIKDVLAAVVPSNVMTMVANFYHHGVANFTTGKINVDQYASNSDAVTDLYSLTQFNSENSMIQNLVKVAKQVPEMVLLRDKGLVTFNPRNRKDLLNLQQALEAQRPTFYRSYFMSDAALASDYNTMTGQIEEQCGEVLKLVAFVNNRAEGERAPARLSTEEELPALRHCMTQIIPDKFQATLIHEIGHTLGLRHNFKASADKENFFEREEVKELYGLDIQDHDLPRSSSVMDYVRTEQDRLTYPGHYDIAAIRYGYANAVEVESSARRPNSLNGRYVTLAKAENNDVSGSIEDELGRGTKVRPFGFCTDIEASLEIDPLCARHDFGTNPKMVVEDTINSFWESFTLYNFRYDRRGPAVTGPFRRASRLDKLKRIYTEWRVHLANHLGKNDSTGNVYLQRYDRPQYEALLEELKTDPNFKGREYLEVRDQIFDFILDVAFFPNKYCLVGTPAGLKAYEFDKLRDELKNQVPEGTKVASCEDQHMQDLITSKGLEYYFEAGLPVDNLWHSVNPQDTFEEDVNFRSFRAPLDTVGSFLDRYFASSFLGGRNAGYTGLLEKMFPNMMDEPDLYEKFEARMLDRLTKGVNVRDVFERANDVVLPPEEQISLILPNFDSESALLKALWLSLEQGIRNQFIDNTSKLNKYSREFTGNIDKINDARENGALIIPFASGQSLIIRQEATVAMALGQAMNGVIQTFQGANQQIPTAEQLTGSLNDLALQLGQMVVVGEGQTTITAEQYYAFASNVMAVFPQLHPLQQAIIEQVYFNDLLMYLVILRDLEPQGEAAVAAKLAEWNAKGMNAVAQEIQNMIDPSGQQYRVTVPTDVTVVNNFVAQAPAAAAAAVEQATNEQNQARAFLSVHGDELFAQYELLRSILSYDFSEVNVDFQLRLTELLGDRTTDNFAELSKSSRSDIREYAKEFLSPRVIAKTQWGVKYPVEDFINSRKK